MKITLYLAKEYGCYRNYKLKNEAAVMYQTILIVKSLDCVFIIPTLTYYIELFYINILYDLYTTIQ